MNMLAGPQGALDPFKSPFEQQQGMFQQNPQQLMTDNYGPPQAPMGVNDYSAAIDPRRMAWGAALMNMGDIIGGRGPSQNVSGAYMSAKQSNDRTRQNKANDRRMEDARVRQEQQDELNRRYRESQITKNLRGQAGVTPANIKEWETYSAMNPGQQEDYLQMKRANRYFDMGGVQMMGSQTGPTAQAVTPAGQEGATQQQLTEVLSTQAAASRKELDAATQSQKVSSDYFERLPSINQGISNLNRGIQLIDEGADTGPISSFFPSFTKASIELDQLQNVLGLDVIGSTTFGALSKGELDLALKTAIPDNLNEQDLKIWMTNKRDAQIKLKNYLEEAAIYLSKTGNTQASWAEMQREKKSDEGKKKSRLAELRAKNASQ